ATSSAGTGPYSASISASRARSRCCWSLLRSASLTSADSPRRPATRRARTTSSASRLSETFSTVMSRILPSYSPRILKYGMRPAHGPVRRTARSSGKSPGCEVTSSVRQEACRSKVRGMARLGERHGSCRGDIHQVGDVHSACGQGGPRMRVIAFVVVACVLVSASPVAAHTPEKLGTVNFPTSCNAAAQAEFVRGVALLHSFWFSAAIKGFEAAGHADPSCGIAAWGAAVAWLGNPLAGPPPKRDLELGAATAARARSMGAGTPRELDYIAAIETFYKDHDTVDHRTRAQAYEKAMGALAARYPQDREAAIFYALSLNITASLNDKTYANQLKAAAILESVFKVEPDHPGVAHYLIH